MTAIRGNKGASSAESFAEVRFGREPRGHTSGNVVETQRKILPFLHTAQVSSVPRDGIVSDWSTFQPIGVSGGNVVSRWDGGGTTPHVIHGKVGAEGGKQNVTIKVSAEGVKVFDGHLSERQVEEGGTFMHWDAVATVAKAIGHSTEFNKAWTENYGYSNERQRTLAAEIMKSAGLSASDPSTFEPAKAPEQLPSVGPSTRADVARVAGLIGGATLAGTMIGGPVLGPIAGGVAALGRLAWQFKDVIPNQRPDPDVRWTWDERKMAAEAPAAKERRESRDYPHYGYGGRY